MTTTDAGAGLGRGIADILADQPTNPRGLAALLTPANDKAPATLQRDEGTESNHPASN